MEAEIAEAREAGALGQVQDKTEELEQIAEHLKANTGLRGKSRQFSNDEERARVNVTKAIDRALREIERGGPRTANHLRDNIETGSSVIYRDKQTTWKL